jgi:uncharacterized protein (DUF1697 family)
MSLYYTRTWRNLLKNNPYRCQNGKDMGKVTRAVGLYDAQEGSHLRDKKATQQHVAAVARLAMLHELANDLDTARHYYEQGLELCDKARIRSGRVRELLIEGLAGVRAAEDG